MNNNLRNRAFVCLLFLGAGAAQSALAAPTAPAAVPAPPALAGTPEAKQLLRTFPLLGKLLTAANPWEMAPKDLAGTLFDRMPKLAQGSEAYPLLYSDQRAKAGWLGEKVFGQYAYESEYYAFDRQYPVVKLHIGRPLLFSQQHGRPEALAKLQTGGQFPVLDPQEIAPLLARLDSVADLLKRFGAKRQRGGFYLAKEYSCPTAC